MTERADVNVVRKRLLALLPRVSAEVETLRETEKLNLLGFLGDDARLVVVQEETTVAVIGVKENIRQNILYALRRLREGHYHYGQCEDCGAEIPQVPRLESVPWATRCVSCQEYFETFGEPRVLARAA